MKRGVHRITGVQNVRMGDQLIRQPLPGATVNHLNPFLLLHHWGPVHIPQGGPGFYVAPHPHRGFMPVTIVLQGSVAHQDSRENRAIAESGDVQWFNAGRGIIHSEASPLKVLDSGEEIEILQLWVNLPKTHKMMPPSYEIIKARDIPSIALSPRTAMRLIAGNYKNLSGPGNTMSPLVIGDIMSDKDSSFELEFPAHFRLAMYVLNGHIGINDTWYTDSHHLVQFEASEKSVFINTLEPTRILLLAAQELEEPVAWNGPFVMNTETEILEAMRDYRQGKMGVLIEEPL